MNKSYGIQNLSFRDESRDNDYNLVRVQGKSTFNYPLNGPECTYAFPSVVTEMSCTESTEMLENDMYTKQEFDNLIQDVKYDTLEKIEKNGLDLSNSNGIKADLVGTINILGTSLILNDL